VSIAATIFAARMLAPLIAPEFVADPRPDLFMPPISPSPDALI
jgi:hypothetical protein